MKLKIFISTLIAIILGGNANEIFAQIHTDSLYLRSRKVFKVEVKEDEGTGNVRTTVSTKDSTGRTKSEVFMISPFNLEQFRDGLQKSAQKITQTTLTADEASELRDKSTAFFIQTVTDRLVNDTSAPLAGSLDIRGSVDYYNEINTGVWKTNQALIVKNVQLEFLEGFLENIIVDAVDSTNKLHQFSNVFGIGFSSRRNYDHLKKTPLLEMGSQSKRDCPRIYLGDVLCYTQQLRVSTRDYSPKDSQYNLIPSTTPVKLFKEETQRLLEARVYTDFVGINQEKPNGLIQIEVAKRINTNTFRKLIFNHNPLARFILGQGGGAFQYVIPIITLSKFEENNRYLPVQYGQINGKQTSSKYVSSLDLLQYQQFAAGMDLNIGYTENVAGKFNVLFDAGFRFGRTLVRDSLRNESLVKTGQANDFGITTLQLSLLGRLHWLPDERFSFILSYRPTYVRSFDPSVQQVYYKMGEDDLLSPVNGQAEKWPRFHRGSFVGTWELLALIKPSANGQLFGRYRFNNQIGFSKSTFYQLQIGYSFYILKNNSKKTTSD